MNSSNPKKIIEFGLDDEYSVERIDADITQLEQKIKADPEAAEALFRLGTLYLRRERHGDAIKMFELCLRKNANHVEAYFLLGNCYLRHDQYEIAARYFLKGLKANPNHKPSLFNIGLCYAELKMPKKAENAFRKFYLIEETQQWREEARYQLYKLGVSV